MGSLRSFLSDANQKSSGDRYLDSAESSRLKKAMIEHPQILEWLAAEIRSQKGGSLNEIPEGFFEQMPVLRHS